MAFLEQLKDRVKNVEQIINKYLPKEEGYQKKVLEAMNYTMKAGGKRIRPLLMYETYKACGGKETIIEPFMAAIEMIHTYSLIHDDLPALDDDDYRRGRKTAHVVYGEDIAILAGDGLLNYAFEVATSAFTMKAGDVRVERAFQVLATKPGIYGMIGGQTADVVSTGKSLTLDEILYIHEKKTAALLQCALMIGGILAGLPEEQVKQLEIAGKEIGLAFQIQDDILDLIGDEKEIGKPVASDEKNGKITYVTIKGLEQSQKDVQEFTKNGIMRLENMGIKQGFLIDLLNALVDRKK